MESTNLRARKGELATALAVVVFINLVGLGSAWADCFKGASTMPAIGACVSECTDLCDTDHKDKTPGPAEMKYRGCLSRCRAKGKATKKLLPGTTPCPTGQTRNAKGKCVKDGGGITKCPRGHRLKAGVCVKIKGRRCQKGEKYGCYDPDLSYASCNSCCASWTNAQCKGRYPCPSAPPPPPATEAPPPTFAGWLKTATGSWGLWLLLALVILAGVGVFFLYYSRTRDRRGAILAGILAMFLLVIVIFGIAIADPTVTCKVTPYWWMGLGILPGLILGLIMRLLVPRLFKGPAFRGQCPHCKVDLADDPPEDSTS